MGSFSLPFFPPSEGFLTSRRWCVVHIDVLVVDEVTFVQIQPVITIVRVMSECERIDIYTQTLAHQLPLRGLLVYFSDHNPPSNANSIDVLASTIMHIIIAS